MKKLYTLLSAVLAFSFVIAILILAFTPEPVEAKGQPAIWWDLETDQGYTASFQAPRSFAKGACGIDLYDPPESLLDEDFVGIIIHVYKAGTNHDICRFK